MVGGQVGFQKGLAAQGSITSQARLSVDSEVGSKTRLVFQGLAGGLPVSSCCFSTPNC